MVPVRFLPEEQGDPCMLFLYRAGLMMIIENVHPIVYELEYKLMWSIETELSVHLKSRAMDIDQRRMQIIIMKSFIAWEN